MKVLKFPHPMLKKPTVPWDFEKKDSKVELLFMSIDLEKALDEMPHGAALAANQVGLPHRLFVVKQKIAEEHGIPPLIVNPQIIGLLSGEQEDDEGCLSFPGTILRIRRLKEIECIYQTIEGRSCTSRLSGWIARVFQHECEHLDGKTFLDKLGRIERYQVYGKIVSKNSKGRPWHA